jgi:hypothetical protein
LTPNSGYPGETLEIHITGNDFDYVTEVAGTAIGVQWLTVTSFTIDSNTHITAQVSIDLSAPLGTSAGGFYVANPWDWRIIPFEVLELQDFEVEVGGATFQVDTFSNTSVSDFLFDQSTNAISFNVTGPEGTSGHVNVTIPKQLLVEPFVCYLDDTIVTPIITSDATDTHLYFEYTLSSRKIEIVGTVRALILGLEPTVFYTLIGGILATIGVIAIFLFLRRR